MAKEFMANIEKRFAKNEKAKIDTFLTNLTSMWYTKNNKKVADTTPQKKQQKNSTKYNVNPTLVSSGTIHISVFMQGCQNYREPNDGERYIYIGNGNSVEVEAIGIFR
ncbi:hypothetical protein PVK06_023812 [Gossypium arboreum]|uniref:Uncharacterized protein n=1 Tax=Gossypium arboreum TaxID=29729 RepID=A0ABR0PC74_GOSAR|nr:hypothetical protein PVK06_023812 [Gossypium arboreum]